MAKGSRLWAAPLFNPYLETHIFAVGMAAGVAHYVGGRGTAQPRTVFLPPALAGVRRRLWRQGWLGA